MTSARRALLLALLVVPLALAARWHASAEAAGPRFHPRPDALEYAASAQAIAQTGRYYLQVGPVQVRPRYPPGWPLVLAAAVRLGVGPADLWRVTGVFGAALAWLLALIATRATVALTPEGSDRARAWAALAAGLLAGWIWALAPVAVEVGGTLLSDEPAALAAVAALAFTGAAILGEERGAERWSILPAAAGGLATGLCAAVRPISAVLLAPPLLIFLLAAFRRSGARPLLPRLAIWAVGAAVFPLAVLALLHRSGLPLTEWSGYAFWLPERYARLSDTFNLRYALTPDETFRLALDGVPVSHLGLAARVLLGLPGLRVHHQLGLFWPVIGWLAAVPLLRAARRRPEFPARAVALALLLWVVAHIAVFSLYFYPAARFYLAPLALCTVLLAASSGVRLARPDRRARLAEAVAAVVILFLVGAAWVDLQREPPPRPRDERIWSRFARWRARSDAERAGRAVPFDPVVAQALGLLTPEVASAVHEWGELPSTPHVRRLRALGLLPNLL